MHATCYLCNQRGANIRAWPTGPYVHRECMAMQFAYVMRCGRIVLDDEERGERAIIARAEERIEPRD